MQSKSSIARLKEHQAIVAVVREMLTIINEMLRNREEYRTETPKPMRSHEITPLAMKEDDMRKREYREPSLNDLFQLESTCVQMRSTGSGSGRTRT